MPGHKNSEGCRLVRSGVQHAQGGQKKMRGKNTVRWQLCFSCHVLPAWHSTEPSQSLHLKLCGFSNPRWAFLPWLDGLVWPPFGASSFWVPTAPHGREFSGRIIPAVKRHSFGHCKSAVWLVILVVLVYPLVALPCPLWAAMVRTSGEQDTGVRMCMVTWQHLLLFAVVILIVPYILFSLLIPTEHWNEIFRKLLMMSPADSWWKYLF